MKRSMLCAVLLAIGLAAFTQDGKVINDRNAEKREVSGFHAIKISNGIDLYISQRDEAVAVSASDLNLRKRIKTEVENGVLKIYINDEGMHWNIGNRKLRAYVSCKTIDRLQASGGSDVFTEGTLKSATLEIVLSGGSDLKGKVEVNELTFNQSGGSDVKISGMATNLKVRASGGSDFHGYELNTDKCDINASGGSDAEITVNKELDADASGGSDINYKGAGTLHNSHAARSASISKKS